MLGTLKHVLYRPTTTCSLFNNVQKQIDSTMKAHSLSDLFPSSLLRAALGIAAVLSFNITIMGSQYSSALLPSDHMVATIRIIRMFTSALHFTRLGWTNKVWNTQRPKPHLPSLPILRSRSQICSDVTTTPLFLTPPLFQTPRLLLTPIPAKILALTSLWVLQLVSRLFILRVSRALSSQY